MKVLQMNDALDPPQNILSSKSVVLISVPAGSAFGEWKEHAAELQTFFAQEGIDAVAYFNVDRLSILPGQMQDIPEYILKREISNLIFLSVGSDGAPSVLGIGPFNGKSNFYDAGAIFWTREFNEIEGVFGELNRLFKTGAFPRTNLLVNDSPEFFDFEKPTFAKNYASFPVDFAAQKIAVPMIKAPSNTAGAHLISHLHGGVAQAQSQAVSNWNASFDALVADDLLSAARVKMDTTTTALLRRAGFTHVLNFVSTDSEFLYDLFSYKKRVEVDAPHLVKFYLRDLRNNNVFLGRTWDAKSDWRAAYESFMAQIEKELAEKGG